MGLVLQILEGESEKAGHSAAFEETPVTIGRDGDRSLRLTSPTVSGKHCVIDR